MTKEKWCQGTFEEVKTNKGRLFQVGIPMSLERHKQENPSIEEYIGDWGTDKVGFDRSAHDIKQLRLRLKEEGKL